MNASIWRVLGYRQLKEDAPCSPRQRGHGPPPSPCLNQPPYPEAALEDAATVASQSHLSAIGRNGKQGPPRFIDHGQKQRSGCIPQSQKLASITKNVCIHPQGTLRHPSSGPAGVDRCAAFSNSSGPPAWKPPWFTSTLPTRGSRMPGEKINDLMKEL